MSGKSRGLRGRSLKAESNGTVPITASTKTVAAAPTCGPDSSQPVKSSTNMAMGTRLRRRLSKIFHHDKRA